MKLLDYPSLLKSFIAELGKELAMRRTVWRVIPGTSHQFGSTEKQRRYDSMRLMEKVFKEMNTRELQTIVERIERKKEAASKSTPKLFLVILLAIALQFFSFGLQAQTLDFQFEVKDSSILQLLPIDEHLEFFHEKQYLKVIILYKENRTDRFLSDDRVKNVTGTFTFPIKKSGFYQFIFSTDDYPCEFVLERTYKVLEDGSKLSGGPDGFLKCWNPIFPNAEKPSRKL